VKNLKAKGRKKGLGLDTSGALFETKKGKISQSLQVEPTLFAHGARPSGGSDPHDEQSIGIGMSEYHSTGY